MKLKVINIKKVKCGYCHRWLADFIVNINDTNTYHFRCIHHIGWFIKYHQKLDCDIKVYEIRSKKISDIKKWENF